MANPRALFPLVLMLAAAAGACRSQPTAPPAAAPVSADVWAVVDGREIRVDDVEKAFRRTVRPNTPMSADEATSAKLNLLDQLIAQDLLVARAGALSVVVTEAELDAAFNQAKENLSNEQFAQELAARNLTSEEMRASLRRTLMADKVVEREVTSKIAISEQEINDYFEANKAQFTLPEEAFRIAQIVVTPVKDAGLNNRTGDDATTAPAAAAKVQTLMDRLKGGASFNETAMDYSEDPQSTPQGGDVGLVSMSALRQATPQLRDAVLKSQPGTVSIVSAEGGYTIVALVAKFPAGQRDASMPDVRAGISATLRGQREQLLRAAYLEALRDRATVVNHAVRRVAERLGPQAISTAK